VTHVVSDSEHQSFVQANPKTKHYEFAIKTRRNLRVLCTIYYAESLVQQNPHEAQKTKQ
jgi:hypothetical protein